MCVILILETIPNFAFNFWFYCFRRRKGYITFGQSYLFIDWEFYWKINFVKKQNLAPDFVWAFKIQQSLLEGNLSQLIRLKRKWLSVQTIRSLLKYICLCVHVFICLYWVFSSNSKILILENLARYQYLDWKFYWEMDYSFIKSQV